MTAVDTRAPFSHLTPFVLTLVRKRIQAGEKLTPTLVGECLRQAVDEDNKRCEQLLGQGNLYPDQLAALREAIGRSVYHSIRARHPYDPDDVSQWNPRWLRCAAELGIAPDKLRPVDYLTWHPKGA